MKKTHQLGDRHSLALSSAHASHDVVSDLCVERVAQTEESDQNLARIVDGLSASTETSSRSGSSGSGGEIEGLPDGEIGKVVVVLANC